ncbi:MAG: hypothetical protein ACTSUO_08550 [Candidatus Thorarchaeota archaeon]
MYKRKIKALTDFELFTSVETKFFVKGEVATVRFKNRFEYESLLKFGNFVEAAPNEPEVKPIPVVTEDIPAVTENTSTVTEDTPIITENIFDEMSSEF